MNKYNQVFMKNTIYENEIIYVFNLCSYIK